MGDLSCFRSVASSLFLTPSNSALDRCLRYFRDSKEDVDTLKAMDMRGYSIHYVHEKISHRIVGDNSDYVLDDKENKHLLESLISGYDIPDIKKKI